MDGKCNFCTLSSLSLTTNHTHKLSDKILFSSDNFAVYVDRGALVEGWLLIVPYDHVICMGALSSELQRELDEVRTTMGAMLEQAFGSIVVFEHGPSEPNQSVGCTVDHAHLHLVPTAIDLMEGVKDIFPHPLNWQPVRGLRESRRYYEAGQPYLFLEQRPGQGQITTHPHFQSQMFRQVIARGVGKPEQYNWREYSQEANVLATIKRLEPWLNAGATLSTIPKVRTMTA
jgi:diadenosine tetraphosphate (Ap4A) HIT family hydrolase